MAILGPTFEEMLHPDKIAPEIRTRALEMKTRDPLDPINLFNITWRDGNNQIYYFVLPKAVDGCGCQYRRAVRQRISRPARTRWARPIRCSSKKNCLARLTRACIRSSGPRPAIMASAARGWAVAWASIRVVVLPEGMSAERFQRIESYGARVIKTVGSESNVKEIYDKTHELAPGPEGAHPQSIQRDGQLSLPLSRHGQYDRRTGGGVAAARHRRRNDCGVLFRDGQRGDDCGGRPA